MKVSVLGGGSFGTVLANIAASNGNNVDLWVRDSEQALRINSEGANSSYHPELKLSENIQASEILEDVVKDSSLILIATPSLIFENIVKRIVPFIKEGAHIISCTKGIKSNPFRSMSEIISINVNSSNNKVGVLSGPQSGKRNCRKKSNWHCYSKSR
jgi:glycerol-3-phosphate dehydrogenase (NAD(P)+)